MPTLAEPLDTALEHHRSGHLREAEDVYRQLLQNEPFNANATHLLGLVAHQLGRHGEAMDCIRRALAIDPTQAAFHNSLGAVYEALGQLSNATSCYQQSTMLNLDYALAHNNLGAMLLRLGRPLEAESALRRAISLDPRCEHAHNNLGRVLRALGQIAEATLCFRHAVELQEDCSAAHNNLANILKDLGQTAEAVAHYQRAVQLQPDASRIHSNLFYALQYRPGITLEELAAAHTDFEDRFGAPLRSAWQPHVNVADPERPLRLGFLSPDLHRHPVGYFLIPLFENLDCEMTDIICYSTSGIEDDLNQRLRGKASLWHDVRAWTDERIVEQIREDRIDILFDLAGHSGNNRLTVLTHKPAPIQITWAGYPATTGLRAVDYILADRHEIPPESEQHYSERVLRMPDAYVCYEPPEYAPPVSPLPALTNGHITFGSFNNPAKIGPPVIAVWAAILDRVPKSHLILKYNGIDDPAQSHRLADLFSSHGIARDRVSYLGKSQHVDLLRQYGDVDIALDPFPYNGGLTTLESLWMGVPVVTCPGDTFAGRHSFSHLSTAGLKTTIADDLEEYVALAASLAGDLPGLARLREGLRDRMRSSPLCDGRRFARNFERIMRDVWREWVMLATEADA
jgi:protein O-GlcNAc transferase